MLPLRYTGRPLSPSQITRWATFYPTVKAHRLNIYIHTLNSHCIIILRFGTAIFLTKPERPQQQHDYVNWYRAYLYPFLAYDLESASWWVADCMCRDDEGGRVLRIVSFILPYRAVVPLACCCSSLILEREKILLFLSSNSTRYSFTVFIWGSLLLPSRVVAIFFPISFLCRPRVVCFYFIFASDDTFKTGEEWVLTDS